MDSKRYEEIITRPVMSCGDVAEVTGFRHSKVTQIMAACRKSFGGSVPMRPRDIRTDSFLRYYGGTSTAEELRRLHGDNERNKEQNG